MGVSGAYHDTRDVLLALEDRVDLAIGRADTRSARALLSESERLSHELGDAAGEALARHQLARVELFDGRPDEAARLFTDALARRHELRLHGDVALSLEGVAQAVAAPAAELAAELLGAAEAVRDRHGVPMPASCAETRSAARDGSLAELGERGYARAHAVGRVATLDVMIPKARRAVTALRGPW